MTDPMNDPFAVSVDETDPFATAEDVKSTGGVFIPRPPVDAVAERLIVLVPRTFEKEAKVSEYAQQNFGMKPTQERWTVDLIVLDGGPMSFEYRSKKQDTKDEYEDKTHTVTDFPYEVPGWRVTWANVIGSLNKLSASPRPFGVGRIRAGYSAAEMRKRKDGFADFAAEMDAWATKAKTDPMKAGERPKPKWHFQITEDAADLAVARSWWNVAKDAGFRVV